MSGAKQEVPATDEDVPAEPEPQREQRPEQHQPDEITNYRMLGHIDLLG
jgi:hypothetical protein